MTAATSWTAFHEERRLAAGTPRQVIAALKTAPHPSRPDEALIFDDATGRLLDLDLRGDLDACLARLSPSLGGADAALPERRPGRPKLGVVPREVTLLPRHWEWLNEQPGGASVALRKLVDAARAASAPEASKRRACEAADHFMRAMAGDRPGYEEAARALYAGRQDSFENLTEPWPPDIRHHARHLARHAFESLPSDE